MEPGDGVVEVDFLERFLPTPFGSVHMDVNEQGETILYNASFAEMEDKYIKYQTTRWVLTSLLLVLAWGIGLLMLIYIPILQYGLRKDFRSRRLYVTPNAIVYKVKFLDAFIPSQFEKYNVSHSFNQQAYKDYWVNIDFYFLVSSAKHNFSCNKLREYLWNCYYIRINIDDYFLGNCHLD